MNAVGDAKVEKAKGASSETDFAKKRRFAAELFERGFGYKKTSAILELSENTVKDWAKAYKRGCLQRSLHDTSVRYSPDVREKAAKLRAQGVSWRTISEATGASVSACRKWCDPVFQKKEPKESSDRLRR